MGYREGITSGKESALQEGFDDGFARIGAPLGRELGLLRGVASALLSFLVPIADSNMVNEVKDISAKLANVRLTDIAPRDLEAEQHAREHLEVEGIEMEVNEELAEKRNIEGIEDMLAKLTAGDTSGQSLDGRPSRPSTKDVADLKQRLEILSSALGLTVEMR